VRVEFNNNNTDPQHVVQIFTAELAVKINLIEKGLKLIQSSLELNYDHLVFTIKKIDRQTRLLFPKDVIDVSFLEFGNEKFHVKVNNFYALPTSTDFEVGVSASFNLWMWSADGKSDGKPIQILGNLSCGNFGLTGSFTFDGNFSIGPHFRITSL